MKKQKANGSGDENRLTLVERLAELRKRILLKKRKANKPEDEKNLTLIEHLAELRKRLIYSALVFVLSVGFCYRSVDKITMRIIDIAKGVEFVFIDPAELLMAYIRLAVDGGVIVSAPFVIFQIWLFVIPGLKSKEKKYILFSLLLGSAFFIAGVAFAYFVVVPTMIIFFLQFQIEAIKPMISFNSYLSFVLSTLFSFGVVFELPILMVLLSYLGILKVSLFKQNRKFIVLISFILGAMLTPPDVVSQIMLAVPMILLFEIGIFLAGLAEKKKRKGIT